MKLSAIGSRNVGEVVLVREGKRVPLVVRAFSQLVHEAVLGLYPRPVPPLGPDPARGSLAAYIPRADDPAYVKAVTRWSIETDRVECALALDPAVLDAGAFPGVAAGPEAMKKWCDSAGREVAEYLSGEEMHAVLKEVRRVSSAASEEARKN